jgi:hypothetical protein
VFESSDGPVEVTFERCVAGHVHPVMLPVFPDDLTVARGNGRDPCHLWPEIVSQPSSTSSRNDVIGERPSVAM